MSRPDDFPSRLAARTVELETTDPDAKLSDLAPLEDVFEGRTVVGMGEATHGTREFFRLKHRLFRFLVERLDFRVFGIEANLAETLAVNDYVLRGEGDPQDALDGIYFWTWNTEAVLALVQWLREYNRGRPPAERVRFHGFDAQYTEGPADGLRAYLRDADPDFLRRRREELEMLAEDGLNVDDDRFERRHRTAVDLLSDLDRRLRDRRDAYVPTTSAEEWELANRHVRTLEQVVELRRVEMREGDAAAVRTRDRWMAENVSWILDHEDADAIALWAHNEHVKTGEATGHWGSAVTMGERLRREYGEDYYALGFEFGSGSFRAVPSGDRGGTDPRAFSVAEPPGDSLARPLGKLENPLAFVDVDAAADDPHVRRWLEGERTVHSIGALFYSDDERNRSRYVPADGFDGLLYVDETTSAVPVADGS